MSGAIDTNRRRHSRALIERAAYLWLDGGQERLPCVVRDISVSGVRLGLDDALAVGSKGQLLIPLADLESGPRILINGSVVRSCLGEVAIQVDGLDPLTLSHLVNLVMYNADNPDQVEQELYGKPAGSSFSVD